MGWGALTSAAMEGGARCWASPGLSLLPMCPTPGCSVVPHPWPRAVGPLITPAMVCPAGEQHEGAVPAAGGGGARPTAAGGQQDVRWGRLDPQHGEGGPREPRGWAGSAPATAVWGEVAAPPRAHGREGMLPAGVSPQGWSPALVAPPSPPRGWATCRDGVPRGQVPRGPTLLGAPAPSAHPQHPGSPTSASRHWRT